MGRVELIKELEEFFGKRVFAIIYNPGNEEGIKEGDEKYFQDFIEKVIKKEDIKECIFVLSGFGGNLRAAVLCSQIIRNNLEKYSILIPTVACSSICYFVLQSDCLFLGRKSILTQIDPIFNYDGEDLRAIKHLSDQDPRIRELSHAYYNPVFENLKRIIQDRPNVFDKNVSKRVARKTDYFIKLVDYWMGEDLHESGLNLKNLNELKVNYSVLSEDIIEKAKTLVRECLEELFDEKQRFMIQTNKIYKEDGKTYFGGIFYS